jgi:hypothetical protein
MHYYNCPRRQCGPWVWYTPPCGDPVSTQTIQTQCLTVVTNFESDHMLFLLDTFYTESEALVRVVLEGVVLARVHIDETNHRVVLDRDAVDGVAAAVGILGGIIAAVGIVLDGVVLQLPCHCL